MRYGKHYDALLRRYKAGRPTPVIENWPTLWDSNTRVWDAFKVLANGEGGIRITDIIAWAGIVGIVEDEIEPFVRQIKALEGTMNEVRAKTVSTQQEKPAEPEPEKKLVRRRR